MKFIERLKELEEKATPGPWQTRFMYRSLSGARELPDLISNTKPEQDWPDAELISTVRNALPRLLDVVEKADTLAVHVSGILGLNEVGTPETTKSWLNDYLKARFLLENEG